MELQTDRLLLRELRADDWPALLAYQSQPDDLLYYHWTERDAKSVQTFLDMFLEQQAEQPRSKFMLGVELKSSGSLIGICGIRLDEPGSHQGEIGYELAPQHWGQGYASEAARRVVAHGFGPMGLHRIAADCVAENTASAHVMEKLGMRLEGRLREAEFFKGRWWDTLLYAMLVDEWQAEPQST
jgi:RimJ/RimL family protein N-acetyltransferase